MRLYRDGTDDDHVAFVLGDVAHCENVLTRVHSECFTGEVLGSLRCDCSSQLRLALRQIAQEGAGALIYLRQEGRGIGLLDKLRAYNLQDQGHDTVDANLLLGRSSDERTYEVAADILRDLEVRSVRLLTNNPSKIDALRELGVTVNSRVPLVAPAHAESAKYLQTKVHRMGHQIDLLSGNGFNGVNGHALPHSDPVHEIAARAAGFRERHGRPFVTLSYAQSLDACLAASPGAPLTLSSPETLTLAHKLRAWHDAVLVGVGTVVSDNPRLTVRRVPGRNPQAVVLDGSLRTPADSALLQERGRDVLIAAVNGCAADRRQMLESAGATILKVAAAPDGRVDIADLLPRLAERGVGSVMVEGGVRVIHDLLSRRLVDYFVITIAPRFIGGDPSVRLQSDLLRGPGLRHSRQAKIGEDLVVWGEPSWPA